MNLTPMRIELLRLLTTTPGYSVAALAYHIAPRAKCAGVELGWSKQGAARWGGGYVKPLEAAGLVAVDRYVDCGVGVVSITEKGRKALKEHDVVASKAQLEAAIRSAE